ncbi:SH3 and multiple ankyrin repeat domains protein 2-like [Lolium rigidum]|uniref:SH3 and multiple ankyrin repeat domains protein 2-like n=1 Tax=Lolium rigidum TaxID=89674 RepID=UPI001F5C3992|nr:SH3 and multiple ankyrin repeat domains protein 2-like [Lolium rigidum]
MDEGDTPEPGPHHHPPPPPPAHPDKRQRRPNVRLAGSVALPSHLPHPRRVPIIPVSRPRYRKPHHHNPSAKTPSPPKSSSPSTAFDDLVLAAAFPRKPRVLEQQQEEVVDVADWLWGLGMGRYAAAFQAHEVDGDVLPCLTMDDLRDMGIGAVGARRKLFCAIQRLRYPPPPPTSRR